MPGLRSAALLALAAAVAAENATNSTGCLKVGFKYSDLFVPAPNSGSTRSAEACQQLCAGDLAGCHSFTWKSDAIDGSFGPGSCWLYRFPQATLVPTNSSVDGLMISGPVSCTAPLHNATNTTAATTMAPVTFAPWYSTVPPTALPTGNCTNGTNASGCTTAAPVVAGSGFPTWAWVLVLLAVLGLGGLAAYMLMGGGEEKPKKKKKSKRAAQAVDDEAELGSAERGVEVAPLLAPVAPEPQQAAAPVPMAAPSVVYQQAPAIQYVVPQGYALPQGYVLQGAARQPQFVG